MKIVLCTHQLPRDEPGGVGSFTVNLAGCLARAGHRVTLIAGSSRRPATPDAEARGAGLSPGLSGEEPRSCAERSAPDVTARVLERDGRCWIEESEPAASGVQTLRLLRADDSRTAAGRFVNSFTHRRTETVLRRMLQRLAGDVLHIQHTLNLSARLASIGRAAGCAVVATVHDFWPICHRIDLQRPDGQACPGPAGGLRCASCIPWVDRGQALNPWDGWRQLGLAGRRLARTGARAAPYLLRTQVVQGGYALAHRVTCPAPFVAELLRQAGFDADRIRVVDYGIPPLPPAVAAQVRPRDSFRFGYLGTLGSHKGVWVALHAARLLAEQTDHRFQLTIHGGPLRDALLRERLHAMAESTGGRITYDGPYSLERLPVILTGLDALLIPSVWRETGPMVWLEAVAAGLPVVASRVGALPHRIRDGEDGLLVPPDDAQAMADAMARTIRDYRGLRQGALRRTARSLTQVVQELEPIYEEALRERDAAR